MLEALGHEVVGDVASGREAVAVAADVGPDAVLLDVNMPDGSGIEAAQEIARARPSTAVVLFSGDPTVELSDADVAATSAISFLPKPAPAKLMDTTLRLAVARARELSAARDDAAKAREQLEGRKIIERAKGILMRRTGSSEQEAYRILQRTSQDRSVSMVEIAKAVLESEPGAAAAAANSKDAKR
jgi:two-component system, response regulator PdtaR